jgi:hypothetical protein
MNREKDLRRSNRVVCASIVVAGVGAAHLIDDFLYGVPAEFGLTDPPAQVLAVIFFALLARLRRSAGAGSFSGCSRYREAQRRDPVRRFLPGRPVLKRA